MATDEIEAALSRARDYCGIWGAGTVEAVVRSLPRVEGGLRLLGKMAKTKTDPELDDLLAEAWYVAVMQACDASVIVYPLGDVGPDLLVSHGDISTYVEVARFRPINEGPRPMGPDGVLQEYGDIARDGKKVINKSFSKFRQVRALHSAIAIWNDDDALEEFEADLAAKVIGNHRDRPPGLEFMFYGSKWSSAQQFWAFPLCTPARRSTLAEAVSRIGLSRAVAKFIDGAV